MKFVATQFDCNRNRETLSFYFNHSLKSNRTITIFSYSVFFFLSWTLLKEKKTMANDDDLDINAINDLSSSSSFPPDIYSTIEKEQEDKQNREENVHNQVDFFLKSFFFRLK